MAKTRQRVHTVKMRNADAAQVTIKPQEAVVKTVPLKPPSDERVAGLAYHFWTQRGCPIGSPEEDWYRAEDELKNSEVLIVTATQA